MLTLHISPKAAENVQMVEAESKKVNMFMLAQSNKVWVHDDPTEEITLISQINQDLTPIVHNQRILIPSVYVRGIRSKSALESSGCERI